MFKVIYEIYKIHTHLLPEADFPGDVCVGVMLLCAAPLQLCLDALRFHWKISGHLCVCRTHGEIEMVEDIRYALYTVCILLSKIWGWYVFSNVFERSLFC